MAFESLPFDSAVEALVKLLAWVEEQIAAMIEEMVKVNDRQPSLLWYRRRKAIVDAMLADAAKQANAKVPEIMNEAWFAGIHMANITGDFGRGINRDAVDLLAQNLRDDVDAALATVGRRVNDLFRQLTLKHVALNIIAGTGDRAAAKTLEREIVKRGTRAFVDKAGRQWSLANYTDMAIRTVSREAMTQGSVAAFERNGREDISISHHVGSCDICLPYDGGTFALPGHKVPGLKTIDKLPPFHPRCKHVVGPARGNFDRLESRLLAWDKERHAATPA